MATVSEVQSKISSLDKSIEGVNKLIEILISDREILKGINIKVGADYNTLDSLEKSLYFLKNLRIDLNGVVQRTEVDVGNLSNTILSRG